MTAREREREDKEMERRRRRRRKEKEILLRIINMNDRKKLTGQNDRIMYKSIQEIGSN
jgi:hypothetical protein